MPFQVRKLRMGHRVGAECDSASLRFTDFRPGEAVYLVERLSPVVDIASRQEYGCSKSVFLQEGQRVGVEVSVAIIEGDGYIFPVVPFGGREKAPSPIESQCRDMIIL